MFTYGSCIQKYKELDTIFAYKRVLGKKEVFVAANFGEKDVILDAETFQGNLLLSNMENSVSFKDGKTILRATEAIVVEI